jgi:hypothetical protein
VETWPRLRRSFLLHFQITRIMAHEVRGRAAAALAAVSRGAERKRLTDEVGRLASKIASERLPAFAGWATLLRAQQALLRGQAELADRLLAEAASQLDATDAGLMAAATRRCRGLVLGGDQGRQLIATADESLVARGVRDPVRLAALLASVSTT